MRVCWEGLGKTAIVAGCMLLALGIGVAQNTPKKPTAPSAEATRTILVGKARALESRGRPDMAVQLWQQILLSDPRNVEAMAGLARDYKLIGSDKAPEALVRLRRANPNDPNIAKIEALSSTKVATAQLAQAGELARQGKVEDAMRIYKQLYGDSPPDGDIALAYYQTLYGTSSGKAEAVSAMRSLAQRNPGDPRFSIELGVMLTYDQRTRAEGIRILRAHPQDANASAALRQALIWDSANPASAAELREYLKAHPQDTEMAAHLKEDLQKLAQMNFGIARTPEEIAAFAALNARRLEEAEKRFNALLEKDPHNGRASAGMGFLRMRQNNFAEAIGYLAQAEQDGYKAAVVENALILSRFWYTMGEASQAFDDNQLDVAAEKYKAALAMRPRSPEALIGLAGLEMKQQHYSAAAAIYEQLVHIQPASSAAWRGLFLSYAQDRQTKRASEVSGRFPAGVRASLAKDPDYLRTLASIYQAEGRNAEAQRVLAQALSLPFPDNGMSLKNDTKLQYAGILMEAKRFDQAAALYSQIVAEDPNNLDAWMGLVGAHHELGQDTLAISDVDKMPPATYEIAISNPGFLSMLGAMYQGANQYEVAQGLLERSVKLQEANGGTPSLDLQLQLAGIYLQRNLTDQAYAIYRQVLIDKPGRVDAWKGLIAALMATHRNTEALNEIAQIPAPVRKELEGDIEFLQTEASLYAASGDTAHAVEYMNRVESHYAKLHTDPPANIDIQNAWLLFNTRNDRMLYPTLMRLGGRGDLTTAQRETVQDIWADWSVRRAAIAMDNGYMQRAVDILEAASQAFPQNMTVRKAVAGGFVQVGRFKESLALYKSVPLQDATAGDFQGAIGAALAANDRSQAEIWLRQALDRFPRDPSILSLAARFEQARGDNQRAADYYRAALAVMPKVSPTQRLAHVLVYPDQDTKVHKAVTAADLQHLLDPNYEPFAKTNKMAPLPGYGPDPYDGGAPVVLTPNPPPAIPDQAPPQAAPQQPAQPNAAPSPNPAVYQAPQHGPSSQQMFQQQSLARRAGPRVSADHGLLVASLQFRSTARMRRLPIQYRFFHATSTVAGAGNAAHISPALTRASLIRVHAVHASEAEAGSPQGQEAQLSANAPHSLASDAWKGLIFSLMAANRNAEAMEEIAKMPPEVRKQLEADVEFEQGEASLFLAVGDTAHAMEYLNRVENFYLLRRTPAPAGMEVQHAWLLYNMGNDVALYSVLLRLDARTDLLTSQRQEVENIWANWAVRRAGLALDAGNLARGVQLLQAASQDYPENLIVRRAVAGAYAKVGRYADSLALFKTIPMEDAAPGDYQGAVGAALGATDMVQAEAWLRQALQRFPSDPGVLALAARFEQARGNAQRATDFWRAALAAMPPGATVSRLDVGVIPQGTYRAPAPGDLKHLLDPRNDPQTNNRVALPSWKADSAAPGGSTYLAPPAVAAPPASTPQPNQWLNTPSSAPLPAPSAGQPSAPASGPTAQPAPIYVPQTAVHTKPLSQPVLIEQSSTRDADLKPATRTAQASQPAPSRKALANASTNYMGHMNLPPSEQDITSTDIAATPAPAQASRLPPIQTHASTSSALNQDSTPAVSLRIASQPMNDTAAQVQALMAEQTDGQLTQGSAAVIHNIPNSSGLPAHPSTTAPSASRYNVAQYTPSAQEAATGAYSAPRQPNAQTNTTPPPQQCAPNQVCVTPAKPSASSAKRKKKQAAHAKQQSTANTPTLSSAPTQAALQQMQQQAQQPVPPSQQYPQQLPAQAPEPAPASTTGLSDEELQERNLPPLRGPWVRMQRESHPVSPRDEAEMQLRAIESGYSAWLGGAGVLNYRSGDLGYDRLSALEAPFEASVALGYNVRLTIVARPVFLDSGQADGNSVITVVQQTTGGSKVNAIPQPIGTLTNTATTLPAQQNAVGLGGEVQLAFPHLAVAAGWTPYNFLVSNFTARGNWKPANGPFTFSFNRDSVKDTQLSYAGLRDPAGNSLGSQGQVWGGVMANQGQVQFSKGDAESGFYMSAGGQYLSGYVVQVNTRIDGSGGAYWRLKTVPEYGNLSIGVNFFGMHYNHNQDAFTHGMGGYFSPQAYFLANVPFTWTGHYNTRWHYDVLASIGVQAFQENQTPLWPLAVDKALQTAMNNAMLPAKTSVGPNYDIRGHVAYQVGPHWFAGGFLSANNSRNYNSASAGFFIRYMFRAQPSTATTPTGIFPTDGLRPFTVP